MGWAAWPPEHLREGVALEQLVEENVSIRMAVKAHPHVHVLAWLVVTILKGFLKFKGFCGDMHHTMRRMYVFAWIVGEGIHGTKMPTSSHHGPRIKPLAHGSKAKKVCTSTSTGENDSGRNGGVHPVCTGHAGFVCKLVLTGLLHDCASTTVYAMPCRRMWRYWGRGCNYAYTQGIQFSMIFFNNAYTPPLWGG